MNSFIASKGNIYNPSRRILYFRTIVSWRVNPDLFLYEALQILHSYKVETSGEGGADGRVWNWISGLNRRSHRNQSSRGGTVVEKRGHRRAAEASR